MTKLNKSLEKELDGVFHAYLLFSNSSRELIKQAKKFAGLIAFNDESIDAHPDINTLNSSLTKHIHGMPLAFLTGIENSWEWTKDLPKLNFQDLPIDPRLIK